MSNKKLWGVALLIILLLGIGIFFLGEWELARFKNKLGLGGDTSEDVSDKNEPDAASERGVEPALVDPRIDAPAPASRGADTASRTEYATEPVYDISERGHEYMRYIPRDPSRFAHLPAPPLPPLRCLRTAPNISYFHQNGLMGCIVEQNHHLPMMINSLKK